MRKSHLKNLHQSDHVAVKHGGKAKTTIGDALGAWYAVNHRRGLPWRTTIKTCGIPYHVWLSEVMLQQTTVPTVIAYFNKFLDRWPTLDDLASATQEDVLHAFAGLGYYTRGRNLHACAKVIKEQFGGTFPSDTATLLSLPGIGPYTAAAIGAMAFGARIMPVDGNVERVITRLYALDAPVATIKSDIQQRAQAILDAAPHVFSGDLAQAFMDLGSTICTPRRPKCAHCPLHRFCAANALGSPENFPVIPPKKVKPTRYGLVYLIQNKKGDYALVRRPRTGLLAGMTALPTTNWADHPDQIVRLPSLAHVQKVGTIRHSFTHFNLILDVIRGRAGDKDGLDATWVSSDSLKHQGLPRVFAKAIDFIGT